MSTIIKAEGEKWIHELKIKWVALYILRFAAISLAITLVVSAVVVYLLSWGGWTILPVFLIVFLVLMSINPVWKITSNDISRYLNSQFPEFEESAGLFLKPSAQLSSLERLQKDKIHKLLPGISSPKEPLRKLYTGLLLLIGGIGLSFLIRAAGPLFTSGSGLSSSVTLNKNKMPEQIPAQISSFSVSIVPPSYTRGQLRAQPQFSLKAELGAGVKWDIHTNGTVEKLKFIFNDKDVIILKPINSDRTEWAFSKTIHQAGFYQIELDGKKSDLYPIELIPDLPVNIKITRPKQHSTIDFGQALETSLNVSLTDDYGIKDAFISATMASGKGEGVSFTEKKINFNEGLNNKKEARLNKLIDLKALGMKPGDELYFFIKALDNHGQSSRSDVYFVSIVDTAELMSMAGVTNGVNLVPEYFRSQRQIIIDTEKLLKEKTTINEDLFKSRSNDLGVDQKLLRLRYGTFLGEESETEIGGDHDHDAEEGHDHEKGKEAPQVEKFGDVQTIMDSYAHKHDVAEDATFFEPELKARLKAVLTEMWSSELRLRTYKPQEALPYEYKALRLLKDLQQKSRAYVAKTTVKVSQLKEEKRLSGELDKIIEPLQKNTSTKKEKKDYLLKKALSVLEYGKTEGRFKDTDLVLLKETEKYLIAAAASKPVSFLSALKGLRRLAAGNQVTGKNIDLVQNAIQKIMIREQVKPQLQASAPGAELYRSYFNQLNKANR